MRSKQKSGHLKRGVMAAQREGKGPNGKGQALALLNDEVFMQRQFVPKDVYSAIRRNIPNIHLMKMRHHFDDYGRLKCGETNTI